MHREYELKHTNAERGLIMSYTKELENVTVFGFEIDVFEYGSSMPNPNGDYCTYGFRIRNPQNECEVYQDMEGFYTEKDARCTAAQHLNTLMQEGA